jgi:RHS repeat-associated protein
MTDASGVTTYGYDGRNRLESKQTPFSTLSYTYDVAGNIETLRSSNANGVSVDYSYDELNRLSSVKDNRLVGNQSTSYSYDAVGNLQSYLYPNQVTSTYGYNNLNRLTTMTVNNGTTNLSSYQYTLGPTGNRTQVVEKDGRTVNYVYDDLYRLTSETIANSANNGSTGYQYDAVGNRLQRTSTVGQVPNQTLTYDTNDRLNSDTYDDNGNTKLSNGKTYNYDFENKLTSTSDGITIVYDGDGNRVAKTVNGQATFYLVDTNNLTGYAQVVEELRSGVGVVKAYTYGSDLISQRQVTNGGIVNFYQYDGHGSVRQLTDASASITDTYTYDAFGNLIERSGSTDNNYLYAGEQFDPDLGFYYNRARYLDVSSGRFTATDQFEGEEKDTRSLHKYVYSSCDPVNQVDPTGFYSQEDGYDAEDAIFEIYERDHPTDGATGGKWARLGTVGHRLKPDILNPTTQRFLEIKPFSISGIYSGGIQLALYSAAFAPFGYLPDYDWIPSDRKITIRGRPALFVNVGGLIFYTDELRLSEEFLALTTIVGASELLRIGAAGEIGRIAQTARLGLAGAEAQLEAEVNLAVLESSL